MQTYDESLLNKLTQTMLYEGYSFCPSALKNKKPIPFGVVFPRSYSAKHINTNGFMRTQCLLNASPDAKIEVLVRFLHLVKVELYRKVNGDFVRAEDFMADSHHFTEGWQAVERQIDYGEMSVSDSVNKRNIKPISFSGSAIAENIFSEAGVVGRRIFRVYPIGGRAELEVSGGGRENLWRITARITNQTNLKNAESMEHDMAMCQSFIAVHTILKTDKGKFLSSQNPPVEFTEGTSVCKNMNTWPVLIDHENKMMLSSPVILYDHPQVNSNSKDDLFDKTEMLATI